MEKLHSLRRQIRDLHLADEESVLKSLIEKADIQEIERKAFSATAIKRIEDIRADDNPGLMEVFLEEYGLSTDEGVALMCLAEALLRVPDTETIDDLIEDKIAPSSWGVHLGQSSSSLVNASTWALMLTGKVLDAGASKGVASVLRNAIKRLGEPVIRVAVKRAMKEMGNQFVLGETIEDAIRRGEAKKKKGFTYSYDMLGEAALTEKGAQKFFDAYEKSISVLAKESTSSDIRRNPGISIKLSALHPRYELSQKKRVMTELVDRVLSLALQAKEANMGLNIDAEEMDRLDLSLDIIQAVLQNQKLKNWNGFGVVVQAYSKRASVVIDWLYTLSEGLDRKIMVRLVKGAYWDTEIKRAQVEGIKDFPVFTHKAATDVSYICCAKKLLQLSDRIYPQFATHNAHSVSAILEMAKDKEVFEFQALHGMGEVMHRQVLEREGTRCRIYAPVGEHRDLLAYLVRRLLENGANSSFVNQIVDEKVSPAVIASDPFEFFISQKDLQKNTIKKPCDIFEPLRQNAKGWDLHNTDDIAEIETARTPFKNKTWSVTPLIVGKYKGEYPQDVVNPALPHDIVGSVIDATKEDVELALSKAKDWSHTSLNNRCMILNKAASICEERFGELFAVLTREAGKTTRDAIAELRETVDFLRYYAADAQRIYKHDSNRISRGVISCISPWNFPLAIFTGQIAAALAAGNGVLAKPAESTPIIAFLAVNILYDAGVPKDVLQLLPGTGTIIGAKLTSDRRIKGVCFTGSTMTAQHINKSMAADIDPNAPLIAETGGLNAMIVDSTALPEQAVKDIVASAFQSAGQRCSALRLLYVQEDVADEFINMLLGAMEQQRIGNPWSYSTDIGPIINDEAKQKIIQYIDQANIEGRVLEKLQTPKEGSFVGPTIISVSGLEDLKEEIFGPVLHIATFKSHDLQKIIADINASGYGLTFGLHTRIDQRVEVLSQALKVGNMYVNRNQIGAIVGSQPFGGEGLSGTGPKAGGPHYIKRFTQDVKQTSRHISNSKENIKPLSFEVVQSAISSSKMALETVLNTLELPGPTGESNRLSLHPRGRILCLGPTLEYAKAQAELAQKCGCSAIIICSGAQGDQCVDGVIDYSDLSRLTDIDGVALWHDVEAQRHIRRALSQRKGAILPLLDETDMGERCVLERHICIDTTASGGNVSLLTNN